MSSNCNGALLLAHFCGSDDSSVNSMQLSIKAAILSPSAIFLTLGIARAPMPIYALQIITLTAKLARRHTAHIPQRRQFVLVRFIVMVVGTWIVRTIIT